MKNGIKIPITVYPYINVMRNRYWNLLAYTRKSAIINEVVEFRRLIIQK
jgi:hypothetical protein